MVDHKCGLASISRPDTTASDENKVEMPLRFDPMTIALVAHNRAARTVQQTRTTSQYTAK